VLSVLIYFDYHLIHPSESSFFVFPHRLILKTCGTTLNLLGLPRILEIAANHANLPSVDRCFYSRKSFMFPERQSGPHRDWKEEVQYLDNIFTNGAAYTVGKVNGDHWLLYIMEQPSSDCPRPHSPEDAPDKGEGKHSDYTIEILMSGLSHDARQPFFSPADDLVESPSHAQLLSKRLGISSIFPPHLTTLDAFTFNPCGYSSNALIKWEEDLPNTGCDSTIEGSESQGGEGYYTIHVTPEEGWSYASFECNIPLSLRPTKASEEAIPDLQSVVKRVVSIFEPSRITLTLFISSEDSDADGESAVERAQRAFKAALTECPGDQGRISQVYKRTDKINYGFGGYDLAFASFELLPFAMEMAVV